MRKQYSKVQINKAVKGRRRGHFNTSEAKQADLDALTPQTHRKGERMRGLLQVGEKVGGGSLRFTIWPPQNAFNHTGTRVGVVQV